MTQITLNWRAPSKEDIGKDLLIFDARLVDPDACPSGITAGTITYGADGESLVPVIAQWCIYHDEFHTVQGPDLMIFVADLEPYRGLSS